MEQLFKHSLRIILESNKKIIPEKIPSPLIPLNFESECKKKISFVKSLHNLPSVTSYKSEICFPYNINYLLKRKMKEARA